MRQYRYALIICAVLSVLAIWNFTHSPNKPAPQPPEISVQSVEYQSVPGWAKADKEGLIEVFLRSCDVLENRDASVAMLRSAKIELVALFGSVGDWLPACQAARKHSGLAQEFFTDNFFAAKITEGKIPALITGYYEPIYQASKQPTEQHNTPLLSRPDDLVDLDLGAFRKDLAGERLAGRISGTRFIPYADHKGIVTAVPPGSKTLAFMDPNDLLFLQIQGSGRLHFEDGSLMRIGYAAQNGHKYIAIGRTLVRAEHLALEDITMQSIREWLDQAPAQDAAEVRYSNPSYVFFRELTNLPDPALGPLGAQSVQLTPLQSLAIDARFYPYAAPIFLSAPSDASVGQRLFIAQDTGGAIRGAQRADVFFGTGENAAQSAGKLKATADLFVLIPKQRREFLPDDQP